MKSSSSEQFAWNPDQRPAPSGRGYTFSDNPKHPLWKIKVTFSTLPPMTELIKAPSKTAAKQFAQTKYLDHTEVTVVGRADRVLISKTKATQSVGRS